MPRSKRDELLPFEVAKVEKWELRIAREIAEANNLGREVSIYGLNTRVRREIVRRRKVPTREVGTALVYRI